MSQIRNRIDPEAQVLGRMMAKFCDDAEPKARLLAPDIPPRCNSCAFREGPHVANGSVATQMDALKCVVEGHEFQCHEPARKGHPCSGWGMMMLARGEDEPFGRVPWNFSDEPQP